MNYNPLLLIIFDRESISHGPTSLKIVVVVGDLIPLVK